MSMQTPNNPNPFTMASRFLAQKYKEGARSQRDLDQHTLTQSTLAMHAVQHEAVTQHAKQQGQIAAKAQKLSHAQGLELVQTVNTMAQPGSPVSVKHGSISASYTPKTQTPTATPKPGRVPVKKNRGGKKVP